MFTAPCWIHDTENKNSGCSGVRVDIRSHINPDVSSFCPTHHYNWTEWPFNAGVPWGRSLSFPSASHRLCRARPLQSSDRFPSGPPDAREREMLMSHLTFTFKQGAFLYAGFLSSSILPVLPPPPWRIFHSLQMHLEETSVQREVVFSAGFFFKGWKQPVD